MPYAKASWTITTLILFYLLFPWLLPILQGLSTRSLSFLTVCLFYGHTSHYIVNYDSEGFNEWLLRAHPVNNLGVFLLGMASGVVRTRGEDTNLGQHLLNCILPCTVV